ncbi:alanine racemase [Enterobacteriaceae endosymbiont of Donacia piscatrix]|uniref:alanine racemase n=1 Tax=Enterobacteriaceae endosymbiont of Donacia piscatrix TaxID=2675780 RepID=UPI001449B1C3|nr:alanine racemase [Enterobacteriaceae endosymbiont of Donacia piscatrix]QJC34745.1 alanine racemase [Enterobacteriaceae endosymbiont of Donacia piscatrix]
MVRPISAIIDTNALKNNLKIIKNIAFKSKVWSVLKSDAYGHGIKNIYSCISYNSDGFAVLTLDEAIFLRKNGCNKPILLLEGFFNKKELFFIYKYSLTITLHSKWQLNELIKYKSKYPINIYIKINSGMNRLGFPTKKIKKIIHIIKNNINISKISLMTHFAETTINSNFIEKQINNIKKYINYHNFSCSFANSAAVLWHKYTHYDWVRTGIILYGASPTGEWKDIAKIKIKPVMTLKSKIISIQKIYPGQIIGYNCEYYSNKKRKIGIIACGYADGYPRNINNKTFVLVQGIKTKILGNISMDMIVIDLLNIPTAKIGSSVELWGKNIKIDDVAKSANTIGYELMCSLSKRVPRILK